jgi:hypothetical protein
MDRVTCDELFRLMKPNDRVAVLILLQNEQPGAVGQIQFVTYGRSAEDKVESHQLKKFIQDKMYGGDVPTGTTHESFILDAAKNKLRLDACREALTLVLRDVGDGGPTSDYVSMATVERVRSALAG